MRFLPDGLTIPDELLEGRDQGRVVFLCGAGVSYPAGMPNFLELATYVVKELGTPPDAPSRSVLSMWKNENNVPTSARPPVDQIFNLLQQEYAAGEIDYLIAKRLKTKPGACISTHKTILRLSKGTDGKPQIVTTNFDLLFERAVDRKLHAYVPPTLPDLANGQPLNGLVYLHGRIKSNIKRGEGRHGFIVSSSDFGRAYLAEGWATRFIRDLLDQYMVVLLGYSANDPPVRYLLQGLNTRRDGNRTTIFAFDEGPEEEVKPRWRDSGVQALAYPVTDSSHSALWDTLSAWAERADAPLAWRKRVVDLARKGPRNLAPHERGQVASLVRTDVGTKLFADADLPPPGEWLCVFDCAVRSGTVGKSCDSSQPDFDPLVEYGLDDDPPRLQQGGPQIDRPFDDLLSLRPTDSTDGFTRLAGISRRQADPLPARLFYLARWIVKVAHEPVVPWWAARYSALHPQLLVRIEQHVESKELPPLAHSTWKLLIERLNTAPDGNSGYSIAWHDTQQRIDSEGWNNSVLRAFERSATPYLTNKPSFGVGASMPPAEDWSKTVQVDVARFEVIFPTTQTKPPEIPDVFLPVVYQIVRGHLERAAGMLADIETSYSQTLTFYPEEKPGETQISNESAYLFWFRDLFDRMVEARPELVRADTALWPTEERFFFNKLHLYAWSSDVLFSGDEIGDGLLSLSDEAFWNESYRRELLHLLRTRWSELPPGKRVALEQRLVDGPARYNGEPEEDYQRRRSRVSATVLGWLINQHCELGDATRDVLPILRSRDPRWRPELDDAADVSLDGRAGGVIVDTDPSAILNAPLDQIIPLAQKHTGHAFSEFIEYRPFNGLVKQRPSRAVAALTHAARKGDYPAELWRSAMETWPPEARHRLTCLFGARLAGLPAEIVVKLKIAVFQWLKGHLPRLFTQNESRALSILDALLDKLFEGGEEATESTRGDTYIAGERQGGSRRTLDYAMEAPLGKATELLLDLLNSQGPETRSGVPSEIKSRLERLIAAPGEGAHHSVCIVAGQLRRLADIEPQWVRSTVIPWFSLDHPASESAWNGFLYDTCLPSAELFSLIKPHFLKAFIDAPRWNWDDHGVQRLHQSLVRACFGHLHDNAYITFDEARRAFQQTDDSGRTSSIWYLTRIVRENPAAWQSFGKPFLERAWPREKCCQTERTSQHLTELAINSGDLFPDVVQTILPYLVPISHDIWFVDGIVRRIVEDGIELPTRFPAATLVLLNKLVPENPNEVPYNLDTPLEMIAEAKPSFRQDSRWRRLRDITLH